MESSFCMTLSALLALVLLGGCASITQGNKQSLRLQTLTADGRAVDGAECRLENDRESLDWRSGDEVLVRRSARPLEVRCRHGANAEAGALLISRANAKMAANALFLFGAGAAVDHVLGAGYSYPGWVQLVFGQTLVFDRRDEKGGEPVPPRAPEAP